MTQTPSRYTNSQIEADCTCPAMTYFTKILQIAPVALNIHLEYGSAIHKGMERYFTDIQNEVSKKDAEENGIAAFINYFAPLGFTDHRQKNLQTGEQALLGFFAQDNTQPEDIIGVETVAKDREIRYGDEVFLYGGKRDLTKKGSQGQIITEDHKTMGMGKYNAYTYDKFSLSRQIIGYAWLDHTNYINVNVIHCVMKPEVYVMEYYFSDYKMQRWEINTVGLIKRLDDRIKAYRYWEKHKDDKHKPFFTPEFLFPRISSKCMWNWSGCPWQRLCHQDVNIEDIVWSEIDFRPMTDEEKML